jgi:hypothetical protein
MWLISDILRMMRDLRRNAPAIYAWGGALNMPQLLGGLYFFERAEAKLVLAGVVISLMIAAQIHRRAPFSRLAGICHVIWLPLVPMLLASAMRPELGSVYRSWASYVALAMGISVVLDVYDLYRFFFTSSTTYVKRLPSRM